MAEKALAAKGKKMFQEMVPKQYRDYAKVQWAQKPLQCFRVVG